MQNLKLIRIFALAIGGLILCVVGYYTAVIYENQDSQIVSAGRSGVTKSERAASLQSRIEVQYSENRTLSTGEKLEKAKEEWKALGQELKEERSFGSERLAAIRRTAKLTAESLGCSGDLIGLISYLDREKFVRASHFLSEAATNLFVGESAREARKGLANLSGNEISENYRSVISWAKTAGTHCPEAEFEEFFKRVDSIDSSLAENALYGFNIQQASRHPQDALQSTLDLIASNTKQSFANDILSDLIKKIPDDANYLQLASMLPPIKNKKKSEHWVLNNGRHELYQRWANTDPVAAANHAMKSAGAPIESIATIVEVVLKDDPAEGLAWVQTFPEGQFFDTAARVTMYYIGDAYPAEARELASMIGDPKIREKSLKIVDGKQNRQTR